MPPPSKRLPYFFIRCTTRALFTGVRGSTSSASSELPSLSSAIARRSAVSRFSAARAVSLGFASRRRFTKSLSTTSATSVRTRRGVDDEPGVVLPNDDASAAVRPTRPGSSAAGTTRVRTRLSIASKRAATGRTGPLQN